MDRAGPAQPEPTLCDDLACLAGLNRQTPLTEAFDKNCRTIAEIARIFPSGDTPASFQFRGRPQSLENPCLAGHSGIRRKARQGRM